MNILEWHIFTSHENAQILYKFFIAGNAVSGDKKKK